MGKYFGTDGIRGVANKGLTSLLSLKLGYALGQYLNEKGLGKTVAIGTDTRLSGFMLKSALSSGLCSMGVNVLDLGVITTPGVGFVTKNNSFVSLGVVISASHNPYYDNGIKILSKDGNKLSDETETYIENIMDNISPKFESEDKIGIRIDGSEYVHLYMDFLKNAVKINDEPLNLSGMTVALDCAYGASSNIAKELFESLGAKAISFNHTPDGLNINRGCGSLHPKFIAKATKEEGADLGCAFDGDADRVIMCDNEGNIVDGDKIMALYAKERKESVGLPADCVVGTVMSNLGLAKYLKASGIKLHRSKVGDRYVAEDMITLGAVVGGEKSGHIIFNEIAPVGDGMLTALMVIKTILQSGKSLKELTKDVKEYPQLLVNVKVENKEGWEENEEILKAKEKAEEELGDSGRLVLRASGTENLIRVMAEGDNQDDVDRIVHTLADRIKEVLK